MAQFLEYSLSESSAPTAHSTLSLHDALPISDVLAAQPVTTNLLKFMRASIKMIGVSNLQSFIEAQIGERFSRNAETDLVCRLLLEKKKKRDGAFVHSAAPSVPPAHRLDPHDA